MPNLVEIRDMEWINVDDVTSIEYEPKDYIKHTLIIRFSTGSYHICEVGREEAKEIMSKIAGTAKECVPKPFLATLDQYSNTVYLNYSSFNEHLGIDFDEIITGVWMDVATTKLQLVDRHNNTRMRTVSTEKVVQFCESIWETYNVK